MRRLWILLMLVTTAAPCLAPFALHAQSWHGYAVRIDAPDCRLAAHSSDNFIADGKWGTVYARRWQLQGISIGTSLVASYAVRRIFHTGATKAALIGGVGSGVLPHLRSQVFQRRYPISLTDDAADLAERMVPFIAVANHGTHTWGAHLATALSVTATVLGASCFASP